MSTQDMEGLDVDWIDGLEVDELDDVDEWADMGPFPRPIRQALARELPRRWWVGARCAGLDPEDWFPEAKPLKRALRICQACPLRRPCLAQGLLGSEVGIWGGTTGQQRRLAHQNLRDGQHVVAVLDDLITATTGASIPPRRPLTGTAA